MADTFPFTPDTAANALLAKNGTALLIGLCLDQQVRTEKAFSGPYVLCERIGHLDAKRIAATPPAKLVAVFRKPPAIHRYPAMMAHRVRALCAVIAREYANDGARVWKNAKTVQELHDRLIALPGFGEGKVGAGIYILGKYGKQRLAGWQRYACEEDAPWEFKSGKKITGNAVR